MPAEAEPASRFRGWSSEASRGHRGEYAAFRVRHSHRYSTGNREAYVRAVPVRPLDCHAAPVAALAAAGALPRWAVDSASLLPGLA